MDINPVKGGHRRLFVTTTEFSMNNEGKFLKVNPGKRLRYTWEWNGDGEVTEIDVTFAPIAKGTKVRLLHSVFGAGKAGPRMMPDGTVILTGLSPI